MTIQRREPQSFGQLPERTLGDLLAEVVLRGKSAQTRRAYRSDLQHFFDHLPGLHELALRLPEDIDVLRSEHAQRAQFAAALQVLGRITEADMTVYLAQLQAEGYAAATIARRLTPLRLLFTRLHRFQLIALNPLEFVSGPKLSQLSATLWLTREEARRVLDTCQGQTLRDLRDRALITLMLTTGVRSHEVLGLRVEDIQKVGAHTVAILTGKGGARERVKLQPATITVLQSYLRRAGIGAGPIFRRVRYHAGRAMLYGQDAYSLEGALSYAGLKHVLHERFTLAGLEKHLTPHSLRHTAITLALKGKATIPQVQAMARHVNPATTMRYAHDLDDLDDYAGDYIQI